MNKFYKGWSVFCICVGAICTLYYIYLCIVYGFSISLSWVFLLVGIVLCTLGVYEYKRQLHLLHSLPKLLQRIVLFFIIVCVSLFCFVEGYLLYYGSTTSATQQDIALVLGAQLHGKQISRSLRYRLDATITFANTYPHASIIVSGGKGEGEKVHEAKAMKDYLIAHGVSSHRIKMEDTSTNTYENIRYSYALMNPTKQKNVSIITNDFHIARARFIAQNIEESTVSVYPAKTDMDLAPVFYVREFFGFCKDFINIKVLSHL